MFEDFLHEHYQKVLGTNYAPPPQRPEPPKVTGKTKPFYGLDGKVLIEKMSVGDHEIVENILNRTYWHSHIQSGQYVASFFGKYRPQMRREYE